MTGMEKDDNKLITDYLAGDENALHILVEKYLKQILNFTY